MADLCNIDFMTKKILKFILICASLTALIIGGYRYYQHEKFYPSTDDAYVQANIVNIAPQINGKISKVFVKNNQTVKKGQALFYIDPQPYITPLNQAEANLKNTTQQVKALGASVAVAKTRVTEREAQLINTQKQAQRTLTLVRKNFYSKSAEDTAIQNLKVAKSALAAARSQLDEAQEKLGKSGDQNAQIQAAKAAVDQAKINLSYTKVYAPVSGNITQMTLRKGSNVTAYQTEFSIIDNAQWWVAGNFKETQISRIQPGQSTTISLDMYPQHSFKGKIESISSGSGASFALLPPEQATGNWVKVTQRFPVRVMFVNPDPKYPLRIGASCQVTINTRSLP
jgi:membrane fusion protein, multidrug efflux system